MIGDELLWHFLAPALWAGLAASVVAGVVGTFLVVKRLVFLGGGISHAAFGGLGASAALGADPRWGALVAAAVSAVFLSRVEESRESTRDAAVGVLWAVGMAVGVLFLTRAPEGTGDLAAFLFGDVLGVDGGDVTALALLAVATVGLYLAFRRELVAVAFDEDFARLQGIPARTVVTLSLVAVAVAVVFLIQLVGIVLGLALLSIPPLVASSLVRGLDAVIVVATGVAVLMTVGGLALAYAADLPAGPTMVVVGAGLLGAVRGREALRLGARSRRAL